MNNNKIAILGVNIDCLQLTDATERVNSWLKSEQGQFQIVTPNPEFLVRAHYDVEFKQVLNNADLAIADGNGLQWASLSARRGILRGFLGGLSFLFNKKKWNKVVPVIIHGVDFMQTICGLASKENAPIFLLGAGPGVAKRCAEVLLKKYPKLEIAGVYDGPKSNYKEISEMIKASNARVVLVAFGAPEQDKWIAKYRELMPDVRLWMGVGGSFDYIAGQVKRAPKLMRSMGLEWLFRLILQPRLRCMRIFRAVVVFPLLVLKRTN